MSHARTVGPVEVPVLVATAELPRVTANTLRLQDLERRRLARDLHDGAAQIATAIALIIGELAESESDGPRRDKLVEALRLTGQCAREIRAVSYGLHPPLLDELGLEGAIRAFAAGYQRRTGIRVHLEVAAGLGRVAGDLEVAVFRIIQEALSNIHRHSGSPTASIEFVRDLREVRLTVRDHGRGIQPGVRFNSGPNGVGMASMRERAESFGGRMRVASSSDGTTICVTLPLESEL